MKENARNDTNGTLCPQEWDTPKKMGHFNNNGTAILLKENRSFKSGLHSYLVYLIYHRLHQGNILCSRTFDTSSWI